MFSVSLELLIWKTLETYSRLLSVDISIAFFVEDLVLLLRLEFVKALRLSLPIITLKTVRLQQNITKR